MLKTRDIALIGVYIALLIGGQFALSFVAGVEIVTVLLAAFCYRFGIKRSLILVNAFNMLRCIIFGFFPTVVILYFVYYNLFAVVFAVIGRSGDKLTVCRHIFAVAAAVVMTASFTLLDDVITPTFYGFTKEVTVAYFYASLPTMGVQCLCSLVTVALLFAPIVRTLATVYGRKEKWVVVSD